MEYSIGEVWEYINSVKSTLEKSNRYFPDLNNQFLEYLRTIFRSCSEKIESGNVLYRGRIYTADDKWEKLNHPEKYRDLKYAGYDAKESFVNQSSVWPAQGRMNPEGICVLYTAKDIETCIKELNPGYSELISIADIKIKNDLEIANLSKSSAFDDSKNKFEIDLSVYIQELITQGGYNQKDYVFSQFVAGCCKNMGYDGLAYRSKYCSREDAGYNKGINVAVFNYEKCEPIGSKLYKVDKISINSIKL